MDTPKFPPPSNEGEQEILQQLELVLSQLQIRRADRANYVRSQDVMVLYDQTIEQVRKLAELRQGKKVGENRGMTISFTISAVLTLTSLKSIEW